MFEHEEEQSNTATALFGTIAAVLGIGWLLSIAIFTGVLWKVITFSIYGCAHILTFVFATFYHSSSGNAKAVFSKLDHVSIYLLIAGTYTVCAGDTSRQRGLAIIWRYLGHGSVENHSGLNAQAGQSGDSSGYLPDKRLDDSDCYQPLVSGLAHGRFLQPVVRGNILYCRRHILL